MRAPRHVGSLRFLDDLFSLLRWHHLQSEIVAISGATASVAVEGSRELVKLTSELEALGEVDFQPEMAIVCLVGENIRGRVGIASEVFGVLAAAGINIHMIAQGSSEISVELCGGGEGCGKVGAAVASPSFRSSAPPRPRTRRMAPCETAQA